MNSTDAFPGPGSGSTPNPTRVPVVLKISIVKSAPVAVRSPSLITSMSAPTVWVTSSLMSVQSVWPPNWPWVKSNSGEERIFWSLSSRKLSQMSDDSTYLNSGSTSPSVKSDAPSSPSPVVNLSMERIGSGYR